MDPTMPPPDQPKEAVAADISGSNGLTRRDSNLSEQSQTATDFIKSQLQLEADAREALPYSFDTCTQPLGPLRQNLFACLTCNPPPASAAQVFTPAGICYSCSISCHGEHTLVELFAKRDFTCDCGTTRFSSSPCTLRADPNTGEKPCRSQKPAEGNRYNQNYQNRFCGCAEEYDAFEEKGTMFQCLGLEGGCGEDWWHPECIMGLPRDWNKDVKPEKKENTEGGDDAEEQEAPVPPGFPEEDDFESFICYKCIEANPWLKQYAGTEGFLPAVFKRQPGDEDIPTKTAELVPKSEESVSTESAPKLDEPAVSEAPSSPKKRKADDLEDAEDSTSKRTKDESTKLSTEPQISASTVTPTALVTTETATTTTTSPPPPKHTTLPPLSQKAISTPLSLFLTSTFRDSLCHCPTCFPNLKSSPVLLDAEETYEPPLSAPSSPTAGDAAGSHHSGSLYDRGEAALNNIDRVRAIEGVMVYNHLRDKVKEFLRPFAEKGEAVGAEDVKAYFERLRGDEGGIEEARRSVAGGGGGDDGEGKEKDGRKEQGGY